MFVNMAGITHLGDAFSVESCTTYIITKNAVLTHIYIKCTQRQHCQTAFWDSLKEYH